MANVANPRKVFHFKVEVDGLNQWEVQTFQMPETEIEQTEHGDTNHGVFTPGRITFGVATMEKLRPSPESDVWAWNWLMQAQNPVTGGGALPQNVMKEIVVREMDSTGTIALNSWLLHNAWPSKVSPSNFDRMSSDNIIETVEFRCEYAQRI